MKKENRAEIKILRRQHKKVKSDHDAEQRRINQELGFHKRAHRKLRKESERLYRRRDRAWQKIEKRILILEGRLA